MIVNLLKSSKTLVIVATYNEGKNIGELLDAISGELPGSDILVVDDNSPDGTGQIAEEYGKVHPHVRVMHRPGKAGLGTAVLSALNVALAENYTYTITIDADFSHPPRYLPDLVAGMSEYDVMIGSRYVPGGGAVDWGPKRRFMSWGINFYTRTLLGIHAHDCSGNFRCYRVDKLRSVDFTQMVSRGYSFQEEFLYHCQRAGCKIGETAIIFENRKMGKSKINQSEVVRALWILGLLSLERMGLLRLKRPPLEGVLPASVVKAPARVE